MACCSRPSRPLRRRYPRMYFAPWRIMDPQNRFRRWKRASPPRRNGGMLAIDTNLVVRYLVGDDPGQAARARSLIDNNDVFVCTTVLLETEWVLRSVYGFSAA